MMWCDVDCCNFRRGVMWNAIEMQNVTVMCNMVWCGMLHNASCGKVRDVGMWCGIVMCCDCCAMSDVEDAMCCDVRRGGVM